MSELELVIQTGNDLIVEEAVLELVFSGAPGPAGKGLPAGGLLKQLIRKTSSVVDFATEWFTLTAADVAEDVFDNGTLGVDTDIDWANGAVQSITVSAIINLSFIGWGSLAPLADGKAQSGTLIIIDGDLFEPTFDSINQGPLPTYTAGFANVQELASLGPDGAIYNMWQVSNDQHVLVGPELVPDPALDGTIPIDWDNASGGSPVGVAMAGGQMTFSGGANYIYAVNCPAAVIGATYLITAVVESVAGAACLFQAYFGNVRLNETIQIGESGTYKTVKTAISTDGLKMREDEDSGGTLVLNSVSVKRIY